MRLTWYTIAALIGVLCISITFRLLIVAHRESPIELPQDVSVPFTLERHQIVLHVKVNDHSAVAMLLDTGTDPSVIDLGFARSVGIPVGSSQGAGQGGGAGATETYDCPIPKMQIGQWRLKDVPATAMSLKRFHGFPEPILGVIGYSVLNGHVIVIDYAHHRIDFRRSSTYAHPLGSVDIPFTLQDGEVVLQNIRVNGSPVTGNLDTGSSGGISLPPSTIERLGLEAEANAGQPVNGTGYNGTTRSTLGFVKEFSVGPWEFNNEAVRFWKRNVGYDHTMWDVNIGNRVLGQFSMIVVDYPRSQVTFVR